MPLKYELSLLVGRRIVEMGLSAARLAALANVNAESVALLLAGEADVTTSEAEAIANAVGLSLGVFGHERTRDATDDSFGVAARSASTSYFQVMPVDDLRRSLSGGEIPIEFGPHLRTLLDEAPVGLLAKVAADLERERGVPPQATWKVMRKLAAQLGCARDLWH